MFLNSFRINSEFVMVRKRDVRIFALDDFRFVWYAKALLQEM